MSQVEHFCPAAQRVFDQWTDGRRARDWPKADLDEALRTHRQQWQEIWVRQLLAYYFFDSNQPDIARAHLAFACRASQDIYSFDDPHVLLLHLELAFVSARCGKPRPLSDEWMRVAQTRAGDDESIPYVMTRVKAAEMLLDGDPGAMEHIEVAARWIKQRPFAEKDNWQAELDWLQAMRNEYFRRGLGDGDRTRIRSAHP